MTPEEEKRRVTGALAALRKHFPENILSVDTYHAETAEAALEAGADIINDRYRRYRGTAGCWMWLPGPRLPWCPACA